MTIIRIRRKLRSILGMVRFIRFSIQLPITGDLNTTFIYMIPSVSEGPCWAHAGSRRAASSCYHPSFRSRPSQRTLQSVIHSVPMAFASRLLPLLSRQLSLTYTPICPISTLLPATLHPVSSASGLRSSVDKWTIKAFSTPFLRRLVLTAFGQCMRHTLGRPPRSAAC